MLPLDILESFFYCGLSSFTLSTNPPRPRMHKKSKKDEDDQKVKRPQNCAKWKTNNSISYLGTVASILLHKILETNWRKSFLNWVKHFCETHLVWVGEFELPTVSGPRDELLT